MAEAIQSREFRAKVQDLQNILIKVPGAKIVKLEINCSLSLALWAPINELS